MAGVELTTGLTVTAVTERGTHAIVTTSSDIHDSEGRPVGVPYCPVRRSRGPRVRGVRVRT
ncbi:MULTISPECIES: hypothetical protein [Rhodococcus]|uniref:hypothetical protein n=1 Tax=Rhodococcus TaxID=1827 RepID=UPI002351DAF6|nr:MULTISPECIES: hypothetical protein [Rhodococcus]